jgi:hypothetical protein
LINNEFVSKEKGKKKKKKKKKEKKEKKEVQNVCFARLKQTKTCHRMSLTRFGCPPPAALLKRSKEKKKYNHRVSS